MSKEECPDNHSDCASCGFNCARRLSAIEEIDKEDVPAPETTFPLPQIIIAILGFVLGCAASRVFLLFF